jgi:N6-adenosine-specific RNA methylase IME4
METAALPTDKFRILYADPPWKYGDNLTANYGAAKWHFPSMTIKELCELTIIDLAQDDAVLFLWVTAPLLYEAFPIIEAWGFAYKTFFVWDKVKHNMGHYNSVRAELLLICTRGSCLPDISKLIDSVQSIERNNKHSEKPQEFRDIIDTLYPHGKRLELFARQAHTGWEAWGNEAM